MCDFRLHSRNGFLDFIGFLGVFVITLVVLILLLRLCGVFSDVRLQYGIDLILLNKQFINLSLQSCTVGEKIPHLLTGGKEILPILKHGFAGDYEFFLDGILVKMRCLASFPIKFMIALPYHTAVFRS